MKRTVTCLKTRETIGIRNVAFVVLKFSDEWYMKSIEIEFDF